MVSVNSRRLASSKSAFSDGCLKEVHLPQTCGPTDPGDHPVAGVGQKRKAQAALNYLKQPRAA